MTRVEEAILSEGFMADVRALLSRSRATLVEFDQMADDPDPASPPPEVALAEIDAALARRDDGTFGSCTKCRHLIPPERIEVMPAAGLCVHCQHEREPERSERSTQTRRSPRRACPAAMLHIF